MAIITIRCQLGSGAPAIGSLVAADPGHGYVDREIIAKVAATPSRNQSDIEEKEMPAAGFLGVLWKRYSALWPGHQHETRQLPGSCLDCRPCGPIEDAA